MPNWITNNVSAEDLRTGDAKPAPDEILAELKDFNNIIPRPRELNIPSGSSGDFGYFALTGNMPPGGFFASRSSPLDYPWVVEKGLKTVADFKAWLEKEDPEALVLGQVYIDNYEKFGHTTWYSWCVENWGTKWNSTDFVVDGAARVSFLTAWSPPDAVLQALADKYPGVRIRNVWEDEGGPTGHDVFYTLED